LGQCGLHRPPTARAGAARARRAAPPGPQLAGFGKSCMETPLKIRQRKFAHGLAPSQQRNRPPSAADAAEFKAFAGIDNNPDTEGLHGSAQFSVEIAARRFSAAGFCAHQRPLPINISLPTGTASSPSKWIPPPTPHSWTRPIGPMPASHPQRQGLLGRRRSPAFTATATPFSFRYGGVSSTNFLKHWHHRRTKETSTRTIHDVTWTDPRPSCACAHGDGFQTLPGGRVAAGVRQPRPARHPPAGRCAALDLQLRSGHIRKPVRLHQLNGDVCGERSFLHLKRRLSRPTSSRWRRRADARPTARFPSLMCSMARKG